MRTSLRVFAAAVSTLLLAGLVAIVPFAPKAEAVNGIHTISIDSVSVPENGGPVRVTARVTPANNVPFDNISATVATVDGSARAGSDYTGKGSQEIEFDAGEQEDSFFVDITNDGFREPNETFTFRFTAIQGASPGSIGNVTITNDDGGPVPTFNISAPAAAAEGNANNTRTVNVSVSNPGAQTTTLNYATSDGTATSNSEKGALDYTPKSGTLTWGPNEGGAQPVTIQIVGDTIPEPDERFFLNFGSPNNAELQAGQNPANIDLRNDDGANIPRLTLENIPDKLEGDTSTTTQTVTVTLSPAASQIVTVDYATADGTAVKGTDQAQGDYTETKGTLSFPAGTTSRTFTVPVVGDTADEQDETYKVTLSNPINATLGDPATKDAKILNDDYGQITTGPGLGGGPHLRLFGATGSDLGGFMAYPPDLTAGIHVARGDFFRPTQQGFVIGADGIDEIITGPGAFPPRSNLRSRPLVRIFATDGSMLASFFAYDQNFAGGVYVSAGNLDGDTSNGDELVVAPGPGGGPHVRVLRIKGGGDNIEGIGSFMAYSPGFTGGVRLAVGNETGDAKDEIVTAPGPGGGPHVRVWSLQSNGSGAETAGFMAYEPRFTGGVFIAATNGRVVTGPGAGGGPHVRVFNGSGAAQGGGFMAYEPGFTGGVSVGLGNLDNDLAAEVVTGPGAGGGPHVKVFRQDGAMPFGGGFFAYEPGFRGGVEVAVAVAGQP